jgi:hypothetical protein
MLPAERRQVLENSGIDSLASLAQGVRRPLQIDGISEHDGRRKQIEAVGPVSLFPNL